MSSCCASSSDDDRTDAVDERCPSCGAKGARVDAITLQALLAGDGLRRGVPPTPRFCATVGCPVVYFDNVAPVRFEEGLLMVPVHAKHRDDEGVPVCYCYGHTPRSIRLEVEATGTSSATADITREVRAGRCACEVRNPKGSCCLGDVARVEHAVATALAAR